MRVPYDQLSREALRGVVEEFVTREGTDYGQQIYSLNQKVAHVMKQLQRGDVCIVFDQENQTCSIVKTEDLDRAEQEAEEAESDSGA